MITTLICVVVFGLFCWLNQLQNQGKVWGTANAVFLTACGLVLYTHQNWFFVAGALSAAGFVAKEALVSKTSLVSGWKTYLGLAVKNLCFWPVQVWALVQPWLASKL
jgi:hypothetical protein